jgi:biopolymer transport protein ExbB
MKRANLTALALAVLLAVGLPAAAADFPTVAKEVSKDLDAAKSEQASEVAQRSERIAKLQAELKALQVQESAKRSTLAKARQELTKVSQEKADLGRILSQEQGNLKELAGLVRASARELLSLTESAPFTAAQPDRLEVLRSYLNKSRFPGLEDIRRLVEFYFNYLEESRRASLRQGPFVDRQGRDSQGRILTIGPFTAAYEKDGDVGYLVLGPATGRLLAVGGEPDWSVRRGLRAYMAGEDAAVPMDITGGAALKQLARAESAWEMLLSGGPLIWPILLVGLISLVLIVERLGFLRKVRANTDQLMGRVNQLVQAGDMEGAFAEADLQSGRPTSNVIKAGLALKGCAPEVIENGLTEAMLKELPRLERFLTALKVMAAVAPLLGLLGTVTGMINTFQVITAHGTGDPRLMAGGISEALITTQLGLAVAIPVLVAAALLSRKAQRIASDMEEKAVAMSAALIQEGNSL